MVRELCLLATAAVLCSSVADAADLAKVAPTASQHRRPIAVQQFDAKTAVVANGRSGTLSLIDLDRFSAVAEFEIGGQLTDMNVRGQDLLATDSTGNRLVAVEMDRSAARVKWELRVPTHPVSVQISEDGSWCAIGCLWARKVVFVQLPAASSDTPRITATVDLPFAPREQLILKESKRLLVADAFGGRLAVIRLDTHTLEAVHAFPAQNIRGLALTSDGSGIFVSHQILNELSPPRRSEIIWGVMTSEALRVVRCDKLLDPHADIMKGSRFIAIGSGTRGAGDPDALALTSDGRVVITLAGTGEVAVIEPDGIRLRRISVGRRPVAITQVGENIFLVANQLSDSISRIDLGARMKTTSGKPTSTPTTRTPTTAYDDSKSAANRKDYKASDSYARSVQREGDASLAVRHLSLGAKPKPSAAERGEAHFFNARLSAGGWYSCHSCHTDGHSSGSLADTLGDGHEGAPKRILSLLGVAETGPWAWLGNKNDLKDQVHQSLRLTMRGRRLADQEVDDLIEFLKTLKPPPPFQPVTSNVDRQMVADGRKLFKSLDCSSCHEDRTLTSADVYDVGLSDAVGTKKFNPPSLRGVGHRSGLFHDKRAADVEQVVVRYKHQLPRTLTADEQQALIRYLNSL